MSDYIHELERILQRQLTDNEAEEVRVLLRRFVMFSVLSQKFAEEVLDG